MIIVHEYSRQPLLRDSVLYREFLAEREAIARHRSDESEKMGQDFGFEKALTSWVVNHRALWLKARRAGFK